MEVDCYETHFGWTVVLPTKIGKRVGHGACLCMLGVGLGTECLQVEQSIR